MKILFVCENYSPHLGGAEVVFKNLAERFVQQGHQVTVLTQRLPNTLRQEVINGVKIIRIRTFYSRYLFTFVSLVKAIALARDHDLIQTTSFNGAPPAWLAARLMRKKVVITVHEVWVGQWKKITGFSTIKSWLHELLERMIYLLPYDRYLCVSEATRGDALKLPLIPERVSVVYNGFDHDFWNSQLVKINSKTIFDYSNNKNRFIFFSWGRAGLSKGFEYLIRAIPKICEKIPEACFVLMFSKCKTGSSRRSILRKKVDKLNLGDKVKIVNQVPYSENRSYIKSADAVIIPSTAEGFGYAALEAVAMGTPVLISSAGSLPEIISGKYLIFENRNVNDLIEKAVAMAKGQFKTAPVKIFSWDDCVNRYLRIYQEVMQRDLET